MYKKRNFENGLFRLISAIACFLQVLILLSIIFIIVSKGIRSLSIEMILKTPKGGYYFGGEGGVLNAIAGSFFIVFGATFIAILIGAPAALFINSHLVRHKKTQNIVRYFLDALWGIPSIVYGAFGFTIMLFLGMQASVLAGIFTVTLLITPIVIRTFDEVLKTIPSGLTEASLALGSTRSETALKILFRQGFSGFITSVLLAFGRGIGDAASVLFTAGYTDLVPTSLNEPAATLPLAIFFQLNSPIPEVRNRAFAAATILTIIILIISTTTRIFLKKYTKSNIR